MTLRHSLLAAALIALAGCASAPTREAPTVVLVHGAFQDARAWDRVVPLLRERGLRSVAVNLPGREGDGIAPGGVTLDDHRDAVLKTIDAQGGPVVLVGHSFGGITISNVAEAAPEKIRSLVYVAAYLPQADAADQSMAKLAETDQWNRFNKQRQNFIPAADYSTASVLADDQVMLFCDACSDDAKQRTRQLMQREPLKPAATPVRVTAARYGAVPKFYVHTVNDNAVSYTLQQRMVAATPVVRSVTLQTGHSPFLESPEALANAIADAVAAANTGAQK
jgi:pimeloyl-ACP methyl ester carboxylesterase